MKEIITAILLLIAVFVVGIIFDVDIDAQKTKCLEEGGRWMTGMIGGEMSYFCMPK